MNNLFQKRKSIYMSIGIVSFIFGILVKLPYRNYIKVHNIRDFGLSDSLPSYIYILGFIFLALSFSKNQDRKKTLLTIVTITLGASIYEIEQLSTRMVFDIKDVIATILGAMTSIILIDVVEIYLVKKYINLN